MLNLQLLSSWHNWLVVATMLLFAMFVAGIINPYCEEPQ